MRERPFSPCCRRLSMTTYALSLSLSLSVFPSLSIFYTTHTETNIIHNSTSFAGRVYLLSLCVSVCLPIYRCRDRIVFVCGPPRLATKGLSIPLRRASKPRRCYAIKQIKTKSIVGPLLPVVYHLASMAAVTADASSVAWVHNNLPRFDLSFNRINSTFPSYIEPSLVFFSHDYGALSPDA